MATRSIITAIEEYESAIVRNSDLQDERAKALDYYLGVKPDKPGIPDRSSIVSRDVSDSIEWTKPSLLRVFTSGDEVVMFNPKNQEDIEAAEQETDYINYIITQKNDWFSIAYQWFDDALLQKNGYVKAWWDESETLEKETYRAITDDQLALILNDPEVELIEDQPYPDPYALQMMMQQMQQQPQMQPPMLHNVVVQKKSTYGCVKLCGIAPERTRVYQMHKEVSLENCEFFQHWEDKTLSQLRQEGFDVPDDLADESTSTGDSDRDELARNRYQEEVNTDDPVDPSMRKVRVRENWLRFDEDGDGKAELRHVIVVGITELANEECEVMPIASVTPRIWPHRHIGMSMAEFAIDIQDIKTQLQRGFIDNVHFGVNGRHGVDGEKVNLDDMLTSRPAGIVRTVGPPANSIMPLVHEANFAPVLQGLQYFDTVREDRTGSSKASGQISPDVLSKLPSGVAISQIMSASQALTELIARVFAETGVKSLFRIVHALTLKNARKPEVVKLRHKWVTVDPRQWKNRSDMTISVGLGTGSKEQQAQFLQQVLQIQLNPLLLQMGLTDPKTIYHTSSKLLQSNGFKDATSFLNDPQTAKPMQAPAPPPPDPLKVKELQIKETSEKGKLEVDAFDAQTKRLQVVAGTHMEGAKLVQQHRQNDHGRIMDRENLEISKKPGVELESIRDGTGQVAQSIQMLGQAMAEAEQRATQRHEQLLSALLHMAKPKSKVVVRDPKTHRVVRADEVLTESLQEQQVQ